MRSCLGCSARWEACVVRSRAAEAGASAVRPAAKSPLRGCLSLRPLVVLWSKRFESRLREGGGVTARYDAADQRASTPQACSSATKQPPDPTEPNVLSARSRRETASPVGAVQFPSERVRSTPELAERVAQEEVRAVRPHRAEPAGHARLWHELDS